MTTADTLKEIEELQQRCEQYEGISLKLNWDMLRHPGEAGGAEWLVTYEDELLVGFIGLYNIGGDMEICGMVRPGYRRRGIFSSLWQRVQPLIRRGKVKSLLLNTPAASESGNAFLKTLPLEFSHAEFQMKWDRAAGNRGIQEASSASGNVMLRPARADETPVLIAFDCGGFSMTEEDAAEMYVQHEQEGSQEHIMIEWNGQPAGKMRLWSEDNETWIFGLTVDKNLRGLGIGRSALMQTIEREQRNYNGVNLEVALDNPNALKLYESCGFVILNQQDYYSASLD
ncbi:GNAT family N-acetyltransferase [Paenibacillus sp. MMS20-IR301]|uniref:GNAT family N-acetyltransferase n=1 Tax=Paenibacillus sp. MMS20-IR301 TaxID=2895946 RepID=UPI0028E58A07|nr:GNAT family N-acetyltransferase [Paenibacillus sp. MMS20-IR301]WNS44580.1 GNAT family N-acetyltransferase [Paenibacillus sp. MMS20-IR301]